jgi:PLP dependent protein
VAAGGVSNAIAPDDAYVARVAARVAEARERIAAVSGGREVALVAATKTFGPEALLAAGATGCDAVGENYAQELVAKLDAIVGADLLGRVPEVHFIGQLQSNKVRALAGRVAVFETVDRRSLALEIAKRCPGARVLVQVDATGEPGKGGCPLADAPRLVDEARSAGLDVVGLMTVGPTDGGPAAARPAFRSVRALLDRLGLAVCSMGMTDDLEVAVEEGSTQVRVGSALFGPRPPVR